tara:strand:+ start:6858 stop:7823 length:966 start_codon:yes stop_codon:yes gene_type:complete
MANIISTSLSWNQEDAAKYFLQPLFISNNDLDFFDVMTNISGANIVLDKYSAMKDVTNALNTGSFSADAEQSANTNITLSLTRLEVEHAQQAHALFNHIKSTLMRQGIERNNLDGTLLMQMISELLMGGIKRDFSTILWFGDATLGAGTQRLANGIWDAADGIDAAQQVAYTGTVLTDLAALMTARTNELAGSDQVMFVSRSFADKYRSELQATVVGAAYSDLQNGIENLSYNGIPMRVMMDFDVNIAAYGATLPANGPTGTTKTECAFLVARDAIAVGTDWDVQNVDMWYDVNSKENRFRMNYSFGCALKDNSLVATITY